MSDPQAGAEALELAQSLIAQSATSADSIGRIETSHGNVFITHTDGSKVKGEAGLEIFQGDTVETDATGSVGIVFADDSTFSLAEKGSMVVDSMIYDPGTQEGNSALSVTEGVFTFLSGSIAKTGIDAMVINTPTATIGIRGTSLGGKVTDGKGSTITLLPEGSADTPGGNEGGLKGQQGSDGLGPAGEVTISNSVGTQTISQPYQTTQVRSQFSSPTLPVTLPASVVNQAYASAISAAPAPRGASAAPTGSSTGNAGGTAGNADTDDGDTTGQAAPAEDQSNADTDAAAQGAASAAFDNAIAGGASLDDAMAAATDAAVESKVLAVLAGNPNAFGTAASIQSIVGAVVNDAMGGLGSEAGDPLDAGKGNDNAVSTQADGPAGGGDVLDAIAQQATDDADAAIVDNALGLAGSGLLSLGALLNVVANLNAGDPIGDPLAGDTGGTDDFALITQTFNELTADPLAGTTEPLIAPPEATVVAIAPAGTPTVTTRLSGTASYALVNAQNDVLTGGAGNDSITLTGKAEAGDKFDGDSGTDSVFFSGGTGVDQTFAISNTETIVLPDVGIGGTFHLNIAAAGSTSLTGSTYGTTAVIGDASNQTFAFTNAFDGSLNSLSLAGSGGNDTATFANGNNTLSISDVETITGGTGNDTVTYSSLSLTGTTIDGGSGTDSLALSNTGSNVLIAKNFETITGSGGNDTIDVQGSAIGTITGGAGNDTVDLSTTTAGQSVRFTSSTDGASAGNNTGYDRIQNFDPTVSNLVSLDQIVFGGALGAALDDVSATLVQDITYGTNGANLSLAELVIMSATVTTGSLTQTGFTDVIAAIGTLVQSGTTTATDKQNDAIFVINDGTDTGIYLFTHNTAGASATAVESDELSLISVVEGQVIVEATEAFTFE